MRIRKKQQNPIFLKKRVLHLTPRKNDDKIHNFITNCLSYQVTNILFKIEYKQRKMLIIRITQVLMFLFIINHVESYLDISLEIDKVGQHINYLVPIQINKIPYKLNLSLTSQQEFITPISQAIKMKKIHKKIDEKYAHGVIQASSLQGYTFEGWKRFFMEALMYIQQRYYHQIAINLSQISQKSSQGSIPTGLMTLGPKLSKNQIYQEIKKNTEYIHENIISIYSGSSGKKARIQLGGYQESYAYGHKNGVLFYEISISNNDLNWIFPFEKFSCVKERNNRWDEFMVNSEALPMKFSLQSPYVILPLINSKQVQRNFQTGEVDCNVDNNILYCINMTSIDLALNFLSFKLKGGLTMNISLYDLRNTYDEKKKKTTFFIMFDENPKNYQISSSLLKGYYISINMDKSTLLFSPINRFPESWFQTVYVIRFFVGFTIFTIVVAIGAAIWQTFNDPNHRKKLQYGQEGVRLVSYQRPNEEQD